MKPLLTGLALLSFLFTYPTAAQPFTFGDAFPLTDTRYIPVPAAPTLATNGQELLVFWPTVTNIRVAKVVEGERRGGKSALDSPAQSFAVAWSGTRFLLVAQTATGIDGRLLTRTGEPVGEAFRIVDAGTRVKLASNGRTFLLLYELEGRLQSLKLDPNGRPAGNARTILTPPVSTSLASYAVASNGNGYAAVASVRTEARVLLLHAGGNTASESVIYTAGSEAWAGETNIAGNGVDYLAAFQAWGGRAFAVPVSGSGIAGAALALSPSDPVDSPLQAAWNGARWLVGYSVSVTGSLANVHISELDPLARRVEHVESTAGTQLSLAVTNGRTYAAWRPSPYQSAVLATSLPFGGSTPQTVAYAASGQTVAATATSHDATLVAWREEAEDRSTLHAGLRTRDGGWTEREIASSTTARIITAASDGREYLLILEHEAETEAVFLDDRGRVARRVPLPLSVSDAEWDGSQYLLLGSGGGFNVAAAKLSPNGTVSPVVGVEQSNGARPVGIATNGTTTIAAWIEPEDCSILCIFIGHVKVVRLDGNLLRLDAASLVQSPLVTDAAVAWDGARFLAVWDNVQVVRVPVAGEAAQMIASIPAERATGLHMAPVAGGVALAWTEVQQGGRVNRAALVRHDNSTRNVTFVPALRYNTTGDIAALPDGGILYVDKRAQYDAPHHGSFRLMARVASLVPTALPDAPSLDAVMENGRIRLTWTPPPQPVNGYRLEYRIDDGSWHELEQWFDPGERSVTLTWTVPPGVPAMFRVRAFNDAGMSDYSPSSGVNAPRRRSVRR